MIGVGLTTGWLFRTAPTETAEIGAEAPDFTVEVIDGGAFTLSEARGRPVVVNFWASWCAPCREEIPAISRYADANPDVQVIGVAVEDREESSREFAAEIAARYPLALGSADVEASYPRLGLPATYVVDRSGVVTQIHNGIIDEAILTDLVG